MQIQCGSGSETLVSTSGSAFIEMLDPDTGENLDVNFEKKVMENSSIISFYFLKEESQF